MRRHDIFQTPRSLHSISRWKKLDYQLGHYRHCLHWQLPLTNLLVFIPHTENSRQKIHDHWLFNYWLLGHFCLCLVKLNRVNCERANMSLNIDISWKRFSKKKGYILLETNNSWNRFELDEKGIYQIEKIVFLDQL